MAKKQVMEIAAICIGRRVPREAVGVSMRKTKSENIFQGSNGRWRFNNSSRVATEWHDLSRYGQPDRCYWPQWKSLCLWDDLITLKWGNPDKKISVPNCTTDSSYRNSNRVVDIEVHKKRITISVIAISKCVHVGNVNSYHGNHLLWWKQQ